MPTSAKPIKIEPAGCGDAAPDSLPPGIMTALSNLVPDPANQNIWVPRPAAQKFPGTDNFPGFVSCLYVSGRYAYGLVLHQPSAIDFPFCYDLIAGALVTITGITAANCPVNTLPAGAWQPPVMDQVGVYILVAHPGFNGAGNGYFGWINVSNPVAPVWGSGNLATTPLPSPATFVKQFNQRAFYAVAPPGAPPATYASNTLDPLTASNPLILTYGDNRPLYALAVLGLHNVLGGITQCLLIFKSNNVYHLTGDWAAGGAIGTIVLNSLDIAVGTIAPLSVVPTPRGVAFLSQDGFRIIDWDSKISDPIGLAGSGVVVPFTQALWPSRVVAACNGQTIRATTQNNAALGQPFQEWVFDLERKIWHGPHTFPADQICAYGNSYVVAPHGVIGLWQSDIIPTVASQYTENGVQLSWKWRTALLANQDSLFENAVVNSTIYCAGDGVVQQFTMTAESSSGTTLSSVPVTPPVTAASQWGSVQWGTGTWGAALLEMSHIVVPWDKPIVFDRARFTLIGMSAAGIAIGEMRVIVEELEYLALAG